MSDYEIIVITSGQYSDFGIVETLLIPAGSVDRTDVEAAEAREAAADRAEWEATYGPVRDIHDRESRDLVARAARQAERETVRVRKRFVERARKAAVPCRVDEVWLRGD